MVVCKPPSFSRFPLNRLPLSPLPLLSLSFVVVLPVLPLLLLFDERLPVINYGAT